MEASVDPLHSTNIISSISRSLLPLVVSPSLCLSPSSINPALVSHQSPFLTSISIPLLRPALHTVRVHVNKKVRLVFFIGHKGSLPDDWNEYLKYWREKRIVSYSLRICLLSNTFANLKWKINETGLNKELEIVTCWSTVLFKIYSQFSKMCFSESGGFGVSPSLFTYNIRFESSRHRCLWPKTVNIHLSRIS